MENEGGNWSCALLGPLAVRRGGAELALPASRKVRALLAYLALAPRPLSRGHLCELLWDVPNDPQGRAALVPVEAAAAGRRRRFAKAGEPGRHGAAGPRGLRSRRARDRARCAGGAREAPGRGAARARVAFRRRFPRRARARRARRSSASWLAAQRRRLARLPGGAPGAAREGRAEARTRSPCSRSGWRSRPSTAAPTSHCSRRSRATAAFAKGRSTSRRRRARFEGEGLDRAPLREAWRRARAVVEVREEREEERVAPLRRASVAVMPFAGHSGEARVPGGPGDGLAQDVITRLAKLRSLFVIGRGTVFALARARRGARGGGPHARRGLRRRGLALAPRTAARRDRRARRNAERAHRVGRRRSTASQTMRSR